MAKNTRRLCWNCLENIKKAEIRYERLNGTTGRMDKCEGCGKRRLIEEYVIEIRGRERAAEGVGPYERRMI